MSQWEWENKSNEVGHSGTHRLEKYQAVELGSRDRETKIAKNEKRKSCCMLTFPDIDQV